MPALLDSDHNNDPRPDRRYEPRAAEPDRSIIKRVLFSLMDLYQVVPSTPLSRQALRFATPFLIEQAPHLVRSMVDLLRSYPEDLAEADQDPDSLEALQDRAEQLRALRGHLHRLYVLANDGYIDAQAEAVARVRAAAARVTSHSRRSFGKLDIRHLRREALLARIFAVDPRAPGSKAAAAPRPLSGEKFR